MAPLGVHTGFDRDLLACDEPGLRRFAKLCVRTGVTTAADLANLLPDDAVDMMVRVTAEPDYPARIVSLRRFYGLTPEELIARVLDLRERSQDNLRLGIIKAVVDGSIQGFSARLRWPGYYNGAPEGLWYIPPEHLLEIYERALAAGVQVHTHTNGDEATALALDCLESALRKHPAPDHRLHAAALPACRRRAVPAHESARHVRQPVPQPPFLLGRSAFRHHGRSGTRRADERLRDGAGYRRAACHSFRCAGDAPWPAVHRMVRGQPPDRLGAGPWARPSASVLRRPCARLRSARPTP